MNLKSIGLGVAAAAAMAAVSSPAQALSLNLANSSLSLDGSARISRVTADSYDFSFNRVTIAPESSSPPFVVGDSVSIASLTGLTEAGNPFGPISNFITGIGLTSGEIVSFDLTSLIFDVNERSAGKGVTSDYTLTFDGNFLGADGSIFGYGSITTQLAGKLKVGQTVTKSLSGDITAVPTPALLPAAMGFGAAMLRKRRGAKAEKELADAKA